MDIRKRLHEHMFTYEEYQFLFSERLFIWKCDQTLDK
jgi:hypothetical protein